MRATPRHPDPYLAGPEELFAPEHELGIARSDPPRLRLIRNPGLEYENFVVELLKREFAGTLAS